VRIYVPHPYTAIDAVELSTTEAAPECQHCRQQKYKIIRNPDFLNDMFIHTSKAEFTDRLEVIIIISRSLVLYVLHIHIEYLSFLEIWHQILHVSYIYNLI